MNTAARARQNGSHHHHNPTGSNAGSRKKTAANRQQKGTALDKMFINMIRDMYWAEQHLVEHLKEMKENATTEQLQDAFEDHMLVTKKHVSRLEKVFRLVGEEPKAKKCEAMAGLTKEASEIMKETEDGSMTRDAALIIAAQKVEHYEIASYGSLVQVALTLGHNKAAQLLEETLWEEEDTDNLLTEIAETYVNPMADSEEGASMEEEGEEEGEEGDYQ